MGFSWVFSGALYSLESFRWFSGVLMRFSYGLVGDLYSLDVFSGVLVEFIMVDFDFNKNKC